MRNTFNILMAIFAILVSSSGISLTISNLNEEQRVGEGTVTIIRGGATSIENEYFIMWKTEGISPDLLIDFKYISNGTTVGLTRLVPASHGVANKDLKKGIVKWQTATELDSVQIQIETSVLDCQVDGKLVSNRETIIRQIDNGQQTLQCVDGEIAFISLICSFGFEASADESCQRVILKYHTVELDQGLQLQEKFSYIQYRNRGSGNYKFTARNPGTIVRIFKGENLGDSHTPLAIGISELELNLPSGAYLVVLESPTLNNGLSISPSNGVKEESYHFQSVVNLIYSDDRTVKAQGRFRVKGARSLVINAVQKGKVFSAVSKQNLLPREDSVDSEIDFDFVLPGELTEGIVVIQFQILFEDGSLAREYEEKVYLFEGDR